MLVITLRLNSLTMLRINKVKQKLIKQGCLPHHCEHRISKLILDTIGLQQGYRSYAKLSKGSKILGPLFILYKTVFTKLHEYRQYNIYESLHDLDINGDMLIIYLR